MQKITIVYESPDVEQSKLIRKQALETGAVRIETGDGLKERDNYANRLRSCQEMIRCFIEPNN